MKGRRVLVGSLLVAIVGWAAACGGGKPATSPDEVVPLDDEPKSGAGSGAAEASSPEVARATEALEAGRFEDAKAAAEQAIAKNPKDAQAHYYLGVAQSGLKDGPAAMASFEKALELDARLVEAYVNLSAAQLEAQKPKDALSTVEKGLAVAAKHPALTLNRALALDALGEKDKALVAYADAVQAAPGDWTVRVAYAQLLVQAGKRAEALAQVAAIRESDDQRLLAVAANVARQVKAYADCVATLDRAIKLKEHPALLVRRGMCREDLGDRDGALKDHQRAIELDDRFAPGHYYRGHLLRDKDKKEACRELLRGAELGGETGIGPDAKKEAAALGCK